MKVNSLIKVMVVSMIATLSFSANAQVKIGNNPTTITSSAVLDVESTNKGVIFPRVALTSLTDATTIASPVTGLLVYNTGTGALKNPGYYYWDGNSWSLFNSQGDGGDAVITQSATMGPLVATSDNGVAGYHKVATSPDGKYSIRAFGRNGITVALADVNIRSNGATASIIWNYTTEYNGGNISGAANSLNLSLADMWYGQTGAGATSTAVSIASNNNAAWGNADITFTAPEWRRYTWTSTDVNDKTMYVATIMLAAPSTSTTLDATGAPQTKAYIRIEQIRVL
jgi:hypothetical protein